MNRLNAALAAMAAFALPATASAAPQTREPVSAAVSTAGLDLAKPEDRAKLRDRVQRAVAEACNPDDRLNSSGVRDWQCFREMAADAETAVSRAVGTRS